jgi:Uma2 family endonuclease
MDIVAWNRRFVKNLLKKEKRGKMSAEAKPYTDVYRELLELPENLTGEIIAGQLHSQPRPAPRHAVAASSLGGELDGPFFKGRGGPGGWWIIDEPEIHFGDEVLVPDISGWKKARMPQLPATAYFEIPPDWVCEVLSQSTARKDRILKMPVYAEYGVSHIWLLDPVIKTLEAYELENGFWKLIGAFGENARVSIAPFHEIAIDLAVLWGE